jgi:hypothetical protein
MENDLLGAKPSTQWLSFSTDLKGEYQKHWIAL